MWWRLLGMLVVACIGGVSLLLVMPGPLDHEQAVYVQRGSLWSASKQLEQQNAIRRKLIFFPLAKGFNIIKKLQAGEYLLPPGASMLRILRLMQSGEQLQRSLTVPEGYTTAQVIALVESEPYLSGTLNTAEYQEGMFLPETYFFIRGDTKQEMLKRMSEAMQKAITVAWNQRSDALPLKNETELLILASIVEREAKLEGERSRIAAVFLNRLKNKMKLEADPTTIYAVTQGQYILKRPLTRTELKLKSPFNTYVHYGLPPTPIANPGLGALRAVIYPTLSDDLYFVVKDCEGAHNFSSHLPEHISNVRLYRKLKCY